jgi:pimeloyl-ACP methyl ester carboxylesterase
MRMDGHEDDRISYEVRGLPEEQASRLIVWGHGWGQDWRAMAGLAESLPRFAAHMLVDFPGFGRSAAPAEAWGTEDYADAVARLIAAHRHGKKVIWVGHSFGGRVGLQLAARHGELVDGLFLIAAAGLPRRRGLVERLSYWGRVRAYKAAMRLAPILRIDQDRLRERFGSADYRAAGEMRAILVKVVNEDLTEVARRVRCPTLLLYGAEDTETPPEIGQRLSRLLPGAELSVLAGQDHYSILDQGRHLVLKRLTSFVEKV